jgi:2-keto-4-pentenoate hydratase
MRLANILAAKFFDTFYEREWPGKLEPDVSQLSITDAYGVQDIVAQMRMDRGEAVVGFKVGCTSEAIRSQFGLTEPICGRIFYPHIFKDSVRLDWRGYVNCAIEPEMVLKIGKELHGENLSDTELVDGIEYVSPGIEIHNFKFWYSPPTLQELICSGGIHAGLVVGNDRVSPGELLFSDEVFSVYKNDGLITSAPASEIMGGPLHSLRWLVKFLTGKGLPLKKGSLVIPGSPVELVSIDSDTHLSVEIEHIGALAVDFKRHFKG